MGRLKDTYNGRKIEKRIPYTMHADLNMAVSTSGNSFADSAFMHTVDKPFEVHRVSVHATAVDSSNVPTTALTTPNNQTFCRVDIQDTAGNERMTKSAQRVETLVNDQTKLWEWDDPYTIEYQQGFTVTGDNQNASTRFRIEMTFHGYLLKLA